MPRAAGDSETYDFYLNADRSMPCIQLTSVTTILKKVLGASPYLVSWAYKLGKDGVESPDEFRDRRAAEGTLAHETVERIVAGLKWPHEETGYERAWHRFVDERCPEIILSERMVYTLKRGEGYAGTLDLGFGGVVRGRGKKLYRYDEPMIVDIKTKKASVYAAYDSELMQCRAYAMASADMGLVPQGCDTGILILKPNGRYSFDDRSVSDDMWLSILGTYEQMKEEGL